MRRITTGEASTTKVYPDYTDMTAVKTALNDPAYELRTAEGIADETGSALPLVRRVLRNKFLARRSNLINDNDQNIYAPADRPLSIRERADIIIWNLAP